MSRLKSLNHPTRLAILKYLKDYWQEHYHAPSYREIAEACGISSTSVLHHHLEVLEEQGLVKIDPALLRRTVYPIGMKVVFEKDVRNG